MQLATFGMLAVELEGAAGEALNIAEGSVANLEFPVPSELQGVAPSTIPLWSFNKTTGYWEEEGQATFDGQKYVGDVSHFSFWNCDAPFPIVEMEGSLIDTDNNPLEGFYVSIEVNSSGLIRSGRTNEDGVFGGKIPKDEEMTLEVRYSGSCNEVLHTEMIGPFSDDVVLTPITVDFTNAIGWTLNLSGLMEDCNSNVVTKGYVNATYDGGAFTMFPDGTTGDITGSVYFCTNVSSIDLQAFDSEGGKTSEVTTFTVTQGADLDFGTLSVCEAVIESMQYTIDGNDFFLFDPQIEGSLPNLYISAYGPDSSNVYFEIMTASVPSTVNPGYANFTGISGNDVLYTSCQGASTDCVNFEVELTEYGMVGEFAKGTFNGTMSGSGPGGVSTVSGSFVVLIE